ncbi:MAG: hypothetical protein JWR26_3670 [Pedosphaera sp.]|nr:hypothetical protein [Pedosphaera sp.]
MNQSMRRMATVCFLLTILFLAGGCHTFNQDWKNAALQPATTNDLGGRWQGVWISESSGHTDKLRCVITHKDDGTYQARFHAKYHTIVSFGYTAPLNVEPAIANTYKFSGAADLGWAAGGIYHYEGHADPTNFFSNYTSKYDHGVFKMTRP